MAIVEKDLTAKNVERARNHAEFLKRREREQTYIAVRPEVVEAFRAEAMPRESIYLSHPDDEFSLRVQAAHTLDGTEYTATLKDRGEMDDDALDRLEIIADISGDSFDYYSGNPNFPSVKFLRAKPAPGVDVDFIEGVELPQVEYESVKGQPEHPLMASLKDGLVNMSSDPSVRKESIAHHLHPSEFLKPSKETEQSVARRVMRDMVANYAVGQPQVVAGISGMSGSGKTTVVQRVVDSFVETFGKEFKPLVISSDDYHRGKKWLEDNYGAPWTNWDNPVVYNTEELAHDLQSLKSGIAVFRKHFDFESQEVVVDGYAQPNPFVIIEGLFAGSPDLKGVRTLHYEMPTGIATSIGRDIRRLLIENRANEAFRTPEDRLKYAIEVALPTYLAQDRPKGNAFSAHSRPLAERAFMLEKLSA